MYGDPAIDVLPSLLENPQRNELMYGNGRCLSNDGCVPPDHPWYVSLICFLHAPSEAQEDPAGVERHGRLQGELMASIRYVRRRWPRVSNGLDTMVQFYVEEATALANDDVANLNATNPHFMFVVRRRL